MRAIPPLVSTHWLAKNIDDSELVMIDIRRSEEYTAGHIPNAINVPFPSWATTKNDLLLELPEVGDLFNTIGSVGIKSNSKVVIVNKTDTQFNLADTTRVACTLLYGGVKNVAILNGEYNKWVKEGKPVSDKIVKPKTVAYKGKVNKAMFVSKEYVQKKIGKSIIVDARTPSDFFGVTQDLFTERAGHIPSAICLPTPWVWTDEGTYKNIKELREMAFGIVGKDRSEEIIIYCDVGGYTSTWCFVLREVLGYTNVKIYDGAAQEWTRDPEAPVVKYRWN
jgi:thiosulfate/3-mercaptopyruvate sulfurtransferase